MLARPTSGSGSHDIVGVDRTSSTAIDGEQHSGCGEAGRKADGGEYQDARDEIPAAMIQIQRWATAFPEKLHGFAGEGGWRAGTAALDSGMPSSFPRGQSEDALQVGDAVR